MANPLAKVIRYLVTGGTVTALDVQGAIEQLESITTGLNTLLLDHNARHELGGGDEINVAGLSGLLADPQTPLNHAGTHQFLGGDEINVNGLSGLLADLQKAGWIDTVQIDVTGLAVNYTLQYNGVNWIVTNNLVGVTPGVHESTHIEGGSDQIVGELLSPQKAGKIYSAVINIGGLADKFHLRYDIGTNQWIAQTFYHAADHEQGGPDAIASLPTANQKLALAGTVGTPSNTNKYVTELDKASNIDPRLPTQSQKDALDGSLAPTLANPFITQQALNSALSANTGTSGFGVAARRAFIHNQAVDRKGTPIVINTARDTIETSTVVAVPTDKPIAVLDRYCTIQNSINPGSCTFANATSDIVVTNNVSTGNISSIVGNNGFDRGEITLTAAVPALIQPGDTISVAGATDGSNNGQYKVYSVLGSVITVTVPMFADQLAPAGSISSTKFIKDMILVITGTVSNNDKFTITKVVGNTLTVFPAPVNETVTPTFQAFLPDGSIVAFGICFITDGTPHNFAGAPVAPITYEYDNSADHYGVFSTGKWILGDQYSADVFFVCIRENINTVSNLTQAIHAKTVALTDAATINTDAALGNVFTVTLGGNRTLANPTNLVAGTTYLWDIQQDGVGNRVITWDTLFKWEGGVVPVLSTAANAKDTLSAYYDGTILRAALQKGFA